MVKLKIKPGVQSLSPEEKAHQLNEVARKVEEDEYHDQAVTTSKKYTQRVVLYEDGGKIACWVDNGGAKPYGVMVRILGLYQGGKKIV